jgi:hypothetical protein
MSFTLLFLYHSHSTILGRPICPTYVLLISCRPTLKKNSYIHLYFYRCRNPLLPSTCTITINLTSKRVSLCTLFSFLMSTIIFPFPIIRLPPNLLTSYTKCLLFSLWCVSVNYFVQNNSSIFDFSGTNFNWNFWNRSLTTPYFLFFSNLQTMTLLNV